MSWDWDDNTCATSFTFKLGSQDRYFWPDDDTEENILENLVLGLSGTDQGADIVLKPKGNPPPASHHIYSLDNRQFIYSGVDSDMVMDIRNKNQYSGAVVIIYPKNNTGTANQLWYFAGKYIIRDLNGMILTVQGGRAEKGYIHY